MGLDHSLRPNVEKAYQCRRPNKVIMVWLGQNRLQTLPLSNYQGKAA
jgi:hypothetical protein